ncbi:MAG: dihydropteroate synthase [Chloroflexi bacterium]|nr:dihydropteroate synthase [Chloroflexota bacterium]
MSSVEPGVLKLGNSVFRWGEKTYIMGIVNVTPDSFSGDGLGNDIDAAVEQAKMFVLAGADIIDIGGESTRPGSKPVTIEEEINRVIPVIKKLTQEIAVPISIDTYHAKVAEKAVAAGAVVLNDVWGLKKDARIARVAAKHDLALILTQNQRESTYTNFFPELIDSLKQSIHLALEYGVKLDSIIIDPGIGFGKTVDQNLEILRRLAELKVLGRPILLGTSRKSFIGAVLDLPADERVEGTAATVAIGIANGADIVRVHDVEHMAKVAKMSDAIVRER